MRDYIVCPICNEIHPGTACHKDAIVQEATAPEEKNSSQVHNESVIDPIADKLIAAGMKPAGLSWMVAESLDKLAHQWHIIMKNEDCPDINGEYELFVAVRGVEDTLKIEQASYDINCGWDSMNYVLAWRNV